MLRKAKVRFFLTSRSGPPIENFFARYKHHDLDFEQFSKETVPDDIALFLKERLQEIGDDHGLGPWPPTDDLQCLVDKSVPLFIYAATACRYIDTLSINPDLNLSEFLGAKNGCGDPLTQLYTMYEQIVAAVVGGSQKTSTIFKQAVGSIAVLREPLSYNDLRKLLNLPEKYLTVILNRM